MNRSKEKIDVLCMGAIIRQIFRLVRIGILKKYFLKLFKQQLVLKKYPHFVSLCGAFVAYQGRQMSLIYLIDYCSGSEAILTLVLSAPETQVGSVQMSVRLNSSRGGCPEWRLGRGTQRSPGTAEAGGGGFRRLAEGGRDAGQCRNARDPGLGLKMSWSAGVGCGMVGVDLDG